MKVLLTAVLTVAAFSAGSVVKAPGETFELLILHNNDMHARFEQTSQLSGTCTTADREAGKCYGGFPRVAHVVKEARKAAHSGQGPPVLYLNAGDTYTGTAWFTIYKWKIAAEFVNALQPDAVSLGNHEFDQGVSGLTPFIENLTCPVLAANLVLNQVPELAKEPNLKKSVVLDVDGHKVGIVGYLTPETKILAVPNDVEYSDEIVALNEEVKVLQSQGINIIIALGHSGFHRDLKIAKGVEGLDLVIGGHSNTFLWNGTSPDSERPKGAYPTYVKQASGRSVPVVQAYAYTKYLGKLHLVFDSAGEQISADGVPILLDQKVPQDPEVLQILDRFRDKVLNITEEVIGTTAIALNVRTCEAEECNIGNLITDAMVYKYASEYTGEHWTDAPIAIIQAGGIRSSIVRAMPTNITKGDLLEVLPFDGIMVAVTVNGSVLLRTIEKAVYYWKHFEARGEFLQYSGIKVVYDVNRPPGNRIVSAEARCWACDVPKYSKILDKDIYKVLMPRFVATGGDGFNMFIGLPTQHLNYNELISTQYYISHHSPIYPQIEGRITFVTQNASYSSSSIVKISVVSILIGFFTIFVA